MIFTNEEGFELVLNLALVVSVRKDTDYFTVKLVDCTHFLKKDTNSQKLFDWFAAKTEKDMLTKQDVDSAIKNNMDNAVNEGFKKAQELIAQLNIQKR